MPGPSGASGLVPLEEMVFDVDGRTFQYDKVMILDELTKHTDLNKRAVRICRPAQPGEGHEGRIKVQFLHSSIFTYARSSNLFELTLERREALSEADQKDLALYEHTQRSCLGVDLVTGGRVYSTRGV